MSYRLVDKILKSRCVNGPAKAVLIAMASHAKNDGTMIYAALQSLAEEAGVSKKTTQRAIDKLIDFGIVIDTNGTHYWGRGHYTVIYAIDPDSLGVRETDGQSDEWSESPEPVVTQSKASGQSDPQISPSNLSAPVNGRSNQSKRVVSELVSKGSARSARLPLADATNESGEAERVCGCGQLVPKEGDICPDCQELEGTEAAKLPDEWNEMVLELVPCVTTNLASEEREYEACLKLMKLGFTPDSVREFWEWNATHKAGKWKFVSLTTLVKTIESESDRSGYAQYRACKHHPCAKCKRAAGNPEHKNEHTLSHGHDMVCLACGKTHDSKQACPRSAAPLQQEKRAAFEIEEDLSPCGLFFSDRDCQCQLPDRPVEVIHPRRKLVDMVAERQGFEIEEDLG